MIGAIPRGDAERNAGDPRLSATLHFASALARSGAREEAFDLLRQRIAAAPTNADLSYMRQFLAVREAGLLFHAGRDAEAIALLEQARRDPAMAPEYRLNLDANLAMMLARTGSSQRALMTVDDSWRSWDMQADETESSVKLSSGAASFGWIKACALNGLGKRAEADALLAKIEPGTSDGTDTDGSADARIQAAYCMKDAKFLARELTKLLEDPWPSADILAEVQVNDGDRPSDRAVLAAALREPALVSAIAKHVRVLPTSMKPALSGWVTPLDAVPPRR